MADRQRVRSIAICLIQHLHKPQIFVLEGFETGQQRHFYRPLGGGIDLGETGAETVVRELKEETNHEVHQIEYIETLENIFNYKGQLAHEIVRVYRGQFIDPTMYDTPEIMACEDSGRPFRALWIDIADFKSGKKWLVPEALVHLI